MNTTLLLPQSEIYLVDGSIKQNINSMIDELMASLPDVNLLTSTERRGIIARYTAVLEGNFIYWMTATLLAVQVGGCAPYPPGELARGSA